MPFPTAGLLADRVNTGVPKFVKLQAAWLVPAIATDGIWSTCMVMLEPLLPQELAMVHCKVCVPTDKLVTVVLGLLILVIVPVPPITDQVPIPE